MKELIDYILQFGNLNKQQIAFVESKMSEVQLQKDEYFSQAGKIPRQVGFIVEGVLRGCYYKNKGEEITRCFMSENSLVARVVIQSPGTQAASALLPLVFTNKPVGNFMTVGG